MKERLVLTGGSYCVMFPSARRRGFPTQAKGKRPQINVTGILTIIPEVRGENGTIWEKKLQVGRFLDKKKNLKMEGGVGKRKKKKGSNE